MNRAGAHRRFWAVLLAAWVLGAACGGGRGDGADRNPDASPGPDAPGADAHEAGRACRPCHPEAVCAGPPGAPSCRQVSAGYHHACVLWDSKIRCWGAGRQPYGSTGLDKTPPASRPPVELTAGELPVQIAAGDGHSCALLENGQLRCWGSNFSGQLGTGAASPYEARPVAASALRQPLTAVITGSAATCGRTAEGKVLCWGSNGFGQLGIEGLTNVSVLAPAEATKFGENIRDFELARDTVAPNTCALAGDTVRCWGRGSGFPATITGLTAPTAIEAGAVHGCVLEAAGELRCWRGDNLGVDAPETLLTGVRSFATGDAHTCAVTTEARLLCWLGHQVSALPGSFLEGLTATPQLIPELTDVMQVTAGDDFTCALTGDGRLWCWGANDGGQLGLGVPDTSRPRPTQPVSYE